jgi:hypothetical protein
MELKIIKSQLTQIIKEEMMRVLFEEAGEQKYCCHPPNEQGQLFKVVPTGNNVMLVSCGARSCEMLGRLDRGDFEQALASGKYKKV